MMLSLTAATFWLPSQFLFKGLLREWPISDFSLQYHPWIKEMITNWRGSWLWNKFSWPVPKEMYREQYREYAYLCWGVQSLSCFVFFLVTFFLFSSFLFFYSQHRRETNYLLWHTSSSVHCTKCSIKQQVLSPNATVSLTLCCNQTRDYTYSQIENVTTGSL